MTENTPEIDHEDIVLDDAQHAKIDRATGVIATAMGGTEAAESVTVNVLRDIEQGVIAEAVERDEIPTEAAVDAATEQILSAFATLSDGIDRIELPEITYEVPVETTGDDGEKRMATETRTIAPGTYELLTPPACSSRWASTRCAGAPTP
jgi:hypothetical protein